MSTGSGQPCLIVFMSAPTYTSGQDWAILSPVSRGHASRGFEPTRLENSKKARDA
jgi:hypothetical protein